MLNRLPVSILAVIACFSGCFTHPSCDRFAELILGSVLTCGRHTVSRLLCPLTSLKGHFSNYHRFFSRNRYDLWELVEVLCDLVIALLPCNCPIMLAIDDTLVRRSGSHVWSKGVYRDAVRSSHQHTQKGFGHRWLVLTILVKMPLTSRYWALPVMAMLYNSSKVDKKHKRHHVAKTQLIQKMLIRLTQRFADRQFIVLGDGGIATHELAVWCWKHKEQLTLVGRLRGDANLYNTAARKSKSGRIPLKGRKLPKPQTLIESGQRREKAVINGKERTFIHDSGLWYNARTKDRRTVSIRWVGVVEDSTPRPARRKKGDPETKSPKAVKHHYFFITDPAADPKRIIELYEHRWSIEVTFAEARQWLGLETTREWCEKSVQRMVPMQLGLFSLVSVMWVKLLEASKDKRSNNEDPDKLQGDPGQLHGTPCYGKTQASFADALFAVRRACWPSQLSHHLKRRCESSKTRSAFQYLMEHLATAA